jgi:hypothetical protein
MRAGQRNGLRPEFSRMREPRGVVLRLRVKAAAVSARFGSVAAARSDCGIVGPPVDHERDSHGTGAGARIHAALPEGHR